MEQFRCLNPRDILRDRYQIIGQLGEGGFAKTYTANDALGSPENPLCVVKEIPPPESNEGRLLEEAQQQFEKEAKTLKYLDKCPQIPKLIDRFLEKGKFYLIQEYIEGNPLNKEIGSGRQFQESEVIDLLQDILSVLAFVHNQGIIHRDLKPSNLIRCKRTGKIAVIDFGAVKAIGTLAIENGQITQTRAIGTEGYMPAEQWTNQPRFNSDIYAVGIIGIQAIAGLDIEDFLHHRRTGELVWHYSTPDRPMREINSKLEEILNKMVRYHFNDRYQSAAEVLKDLRSVVVSPSPPIETATQVGVEYSIASDCRTPLASNPRLVLPDGLSAGETILLTSSSPRLKQRGVKKFAASNSEQAFNLFKESWHQEYGKDPETLIYTNNAFLEASNAPYYTIAVVLSICRRNPDCFSQLGDQAKEYLRGVAQAQTEVNLGLSNSSDRDFPGRGFLPSKAINGKGLKVIIADDANDEEEAKERAISLVNQPDILAVVGHASSEMTMYAVDIYNNNNLVLMSPGAATEELTDEPKKNFFRTPYTTSLIARDLADYLLAQNQTQAAILYNPGSPFGASFVEDYTNYFRDVGGGEIVGIRNFDLLRRDFSAEKAIEEIQAKGETAIVLVPDPHHTRSLDSAFDIIKLNADRNWIAGAWMLMCPQMLEFASQQPQNLLEKLIFSVGWHPLNSPDRAFPQQVRSLWAEEGNTRKQVRSLWAEEGNTRIASAYDAARALIKALEMQQKPSREGMQRTLSSPDFRAWGATGTIQFNSPTNGDRKNPPSDLVHIVECPKEQFGLAFVPVKYPTGAAAGLKCD